MEHLVSMRALVEFYQDNELGNRDGYAYYEEDADGNLLNTETAEDIVVRFWKDAPPRTS